MTLSFTPSSSFPFPDGRDHTYEVIADGETVYKGRSKSLALGLYRECRRDIKERAEREPQKAGYVAVFQDGAWMYVRKDKEPSS